jgi:hypothetical protein
MSSEKENNYFIISHLDNPEKAARAAERAEEMYQEESFTGHAVLARTGAYIARGSSSVYAQLEDTPYVQRLSLRVFKAREILDEAEAEIEEELDESMLEEEK